jgi:hypothetical protein
MGSSSVQGRPGRGSFPVGARGCPLSERVGVSVGFRGAPFVGASGRLCSDGSPKAWVHVTSPSAGWSVTTPRPRAVPQRVRTLHPDRVLARARTV